MADLKSVFPIFRVASVAKSIRWYADILGFEANPWGNPADPDFAILERDGVEIALQKIRTNVGESRSATQAGGGWDAYLRVENVQRLRESLRAKLPDVCPIETKIYGCREFQVTDPDGHLIVFGECS